MRARLAPDLRAGLCGEGDTMHGYYFAIDEFQLMIAADNFPRYHNRKAEYLAALDDERKRVADAICPLV